MAKQAKKKSPPAGKPAKKAPAMKKAAAKGKPGKRELKRRTAQSRGSKSAAADGGPASIESLGQLTSRSADRQKLSARKRGANSGLGKHEGAPAQQQDPKRRLGDFKSAGEASRKGGRSKGIVGHGRRNARGK